MSSCLFVCIRSVFHSLATPPLQNGQQAPDQLTDDPDMQAILKVTAHARRLTPCTSHTHVLS